MTNQLTVGDLRASLQANQARWTVPANLANEAQVPVHSLGIPNAEHLVPAFQVGRVDLRNVLSLQTANPFLHQLRTAYGLMLPAPASPPAEPGGAVPRPAGGGGFGLGGPAHINPVEIHPVATPVPAPAAPRSATVDWRSRFGWPWITTVQDQDPCGSCWSFSSTGVVESMVRINHAVWSKRSEGDVHDGMGAHCADGNWPNNALDWMKSNGICDPQCYPYKTDNSPYAPCPDRSGRTVKIDGYTTLGDTEQQKVWIDTVGPLACCFAVYDDFFAYSSGVYHHVTGNLAGLHSVLVIGYDDNQGFWIIKNSWGTGWGEGGFGCIGYGEVDIDSYAKYGVADTNPDPWTKRRLHSGAMYESGDGGGHRNFELLATYGAQLRHWWRDNSGGSLPWGQAETFGDDAAACPTLTGTTYNRNFESVHLTTTQRLHHWFFDQGAQRWTDGGVFGPMDAAGIPGFIQSNYGAPGNFEVVVRTADGRLNHWWRMDGSPWTWSDGGRFASNMAYSGPTLVQSHYGNAGNFELVAVLGTGAMQHWWRDNDHGMVWNAGPTFGANVDSPPCMIEGQYGAGDEHAVGNFELCVAVSGQVQHWWRDNHGDGTWHQSATFGHDVQACASLVEGSFGFNLELIVLRTDRQLQHYWRDSSGWHEGVIIGSTM